MLYRLSTRAYGLGSLEPMPFLDLGELKKREKDIEELLAEHLLGILFEEAALLPIFQERQRQAEADIYALDRTGDLFIFELKRGMVGQDAVLQVIRYAQQAGRWTITDLQHRFDKYLRKRGEKLVQLDQAHKDAFQLDQALLPPQFNARQHLLVIGNASNDSLRSAVNYWKGKALLIDFLPYRIFKIQEQLYFEFFSLPYDVHRNPALTKGVLFDTNRSYSENAVWEMLEKSRVSAYGEVKHVVRYLATKDVVFLSHKWTGIIAAAEVIGPPKSEGVDEEFRDVKFLTPVPTKREGLRKSMSFARVSKITGKTFFWARTIKVPYLSRTEADKLVNELIKIL